MKKCTVWYKAWPSKWAAKSGSFQDKYNCRRCKLDKKERRKFSFENDVIPNEVFVHLQNLSQLEEMLIFQ